MKKFFVAVFLGLFYFGSVINAYAAKTLSIGGKVTSLGKDVEGIEVNVDGNTYLTDSFGYYKVNSIQPNSEHTIKIENEKWGSSPEFINAEVIDDNQDNLNFVVFGEIKGKVTYKNKPLKDAIVKIDDRKQKYRTDSEGNYRISNVGLNQEYVVVVSSKGYSFEPKQITLHSVEPVPEAAPVAEEQPADDKKAKSKKKKSAEPEPVVEEKKESNVLDFQADILKCNVTIMVKQGLEPLPGVEITVNGKLKYKTDEYGTCTVENLIYDRKYIFKAEKKDVVFAKRIQTIDRLANDETLTFDAYVDVSGKVNIDDRPFENVIVECGDAKVKTDKDGNFVFKNVEPNKAYTVKPVSSFFDFYPKEIYIDNLMNSIDENNFVSKTSLEENMKKETATEDYKKMLQQQEQIKINAQKKETAKIEKEEKAKLKTKTAERNKLEKEEDLRIKAEILAEDNRVKEIELQEKREELEYKAEKEKEALNAAQAQTETQTTEKKEEVKEAAASAVSAENKDDEDDTVTIQGRVLKSKNGVENIQVMLMLQNGTQKYLTDKNGFYKIPDLEKNKNYLVMIVSDNKTTNISPRSRVYKNLTENISNQNFYIVEKLGTKSSTEKYFSDKNKKGKKVVKK